MANLPSTSTFSISAIAQEMVAAGDVIGAKRMAVAVPGVVPVALVVTAKEAALKPRLQIATRPKTLFFRDFIVWFSLND